MSASTLNSSRSIARVIDGVLFKNFSEYAEFVNKDQETTKQQQCDMTSNLSDNVHESGHSDIVSTTKVIKSCIVKNRSLEQLTPMSIRHLQANDQYPRLIMDNGSSKNSSPDRSKKATPDLTTDSA